MMVVRICAIALACVALSAPALSHPHAWIETRSDVVFDDDGRITAINVEWVFDQWYSELAVEGLDTNNDGYYSAGELHPLARENLIALKDYGYFVYARLGGKAVDYAEVSQYGMIYNSGSLMMYFTLPLAEPIDPFGGEFVYRIYDPSFFIAIDFAETKPLAALGNLPEPCGIELRPPPTGAEIESTKNMLAEKDAEWQPPEEQDFGSMFAQPVAVVCKPKSGA
jgi:ABC-type uncharacterized transport system substrate-binding protein